MSGAPLRQLGRYRILSELGRGAMGVVYRAEDATLGRPVAIKTVLLSSDADERTEYEARFREEAKAAGGLNHPNIITIHDVGREGDMAYMAMEFLDGVELRELMKGGGVPLSLALDLAAQVADGLGYAHEQGIVHRDIKPGNIMVVRGKHAKIMDFGIAKTRLSDIKTQAGAMLGTPKYMSPEQVDGQRADHRSDIFSLGVTIYELVTGVAPFEGADLGQLMYQVSKVTPRTPTSLKPTLPAVIDLILAKALDKDPDERYQEARELAADLRACKADADLAGGEQLHEKTLKLDLPVPRPKGVESTAATIRMERPAASAPGAERPGLASHSDVRLSTARGFDTAHALERLRTGIASADGAGERSAPQRALADPMMKKAALAVGAALVVALLIAFV